MGPCWLYVDGIRINDMMGWVLGHSDNAERGIRKRVRVPMFGSPHHCALFESIDGPLRVSWQTYDLCSRHRTISQAACSSTMTPCSLNKFFYCQFHDEHALSLCLTLNVVKTKLEYILPDLHVVQLRSRTDDDGS